MSEKVKVETHTSVSEFTSSGGFETAIKDFLTKFPDNSAGTVTIRNDKRMWFKSGDQIIIGKKTRKDTGILSFGYPECPECGAGLDKTAMKTICVACGSIVNISKKGSGYFTTIN
ncbi:hypothetical protein KAU33_08835 [Candidatus Dependentiae bacterium]|nr:hypothetical protein [Candidatus Dependentiae bacterium]